VKVVVVKVVDPHPSGEMQIQVTIESDTWQMEVSQISQ
jgi:hypothetical protein